MAAGEEPLTIMFTGLNKFREAWRQAGATSAFSPAAADAPAGLAAAGEYGDVGPRDTDSRGAGEGPRAVTVGPSGGNRPASPSL